MTFSIALFYSPNGSAGAEVYRTGTTIHSCRTIPSHGNLRMSTKRCSFSLYLLSFFHSNSLCSSGLCLLFHTSECVIFGIPGIMNHLSRKWWRDGWLRLTVQAHFTVSYGWAVGQSEGSESIGVERAHLAWTWQALNRRYRIRLFPNSEVCFFFSYYLFIFSDRIRHHLQWRYQ